MRSRDEYKRMIEGLYDDMPVDHKEVMESMLHIVVDLLLDIRGLMQGGREEKMTLERASVAVREVHEIKLNGKYAIVVNGPIPLDWAEKLKDGINNWLKSDEPFIVLQGDLIKLVRVD